MFLPSSQASVSGNTANFTTETELLTIHKAEAIQAGQTPESHFFLHWTALGHFSSMRTTAFVLLSALVLPTILRVSPS